MTIYQIHVEGQCDCVSDRFTCKSKKVYKHVPTQEEIDEFVNNCTHGYFINLNKNKPYKTIIAELELID